MTASKLALGPQTSSIETQETTTSTSYTDLATPGPSVTVTVGSNGILLVGWSMRSAPSVASTRTQMGIALSGANTMAASSSSYRPITQRDPSTAGGNSGATGTTVQLLTGLNPGATTITAKYLVQTGTGTFFDRLIWALPL